MINQLKIEGPEGLVGWLLRAPSELLYRVLWLGYEYALDGGQLGELFQHWGQLLLVGDGFV